MFFLILYFCSAYEIEKIPKFGSPPTRRYGTSAVFDIFTNKILVFGGFDNILGTYHLEINTFSLTSNSWGEILPESLIYPMAFSEGHSCIRSDRVILVFFGQNILGFNSNVYSFDLKTFLWKIESLSGDLILGRTAYSHTFFKYLDKEYVAIFGGLTHDGRSNDLYLIDVWTLEVELLDKKGEIPSGTMGAALDFYENSLYLFGYSILSTDLENAQSLYKYDLALKVWEIVEVREEKPEARVYHHSFVYEGEMYILGGTFFETSVFYNSFWKFNFAAARWVLLADEPEYSLFDYSFVLIGAKAYCLFGTDEQGLLNSVFYLDLTEPLPTKNYLGLSWDSPKARKNHCSVMIDNHMYIFGGVTSNNEYLNDIWYFDIEKNNWNYVVTSGDVPTGRELHSCVGILDSNILIFGGSNGNTIYNDFYLYTPSSAVWKIVKVDSGLSPSPRYSSCLIYDMFYAFILGGRDKMGIFTEIWVYDYLNNKYILVNSEDSLKINFVNYFCWLDKTNGLAIYVIGGQTINSSPSSNLYKIEITITDSQIFTNTTLQYTLKNIPLSFSAFIHSGDYVYILFGALWNFLVYSEILAFNYKLYEEHVWTLDSEMLKYGHSAVHYADSIYVFGGAIPSGNIIISNRVSNQLVKLKRSDEVLSSLSCSLGTISPDCNTCDFGYYEDNDKCVPCPPGTKSGIIISAIFGCNFCPFGNYNPTPGSQYCLNCPSSSYCPIGSSELSHRNEILEYQSIQPSDYSTNATIVGNYTRILWYGLGIIILSIGFISFIFCNLWEKIKNFDFFVSQHSQELNVPVLYKKTHIGGFFSIFFLLLAGVTTVNLFITFYYDNISESKSLVPVQLLNSDIKADYFDVTTSFYTYSDDCVINSQCAEDNKFLESGFIFDSKELNCTKEASICKITIKYKGFSIMNSASLTIQMKELTATATAITVNVSCSSSIPNEKSSIFFPVKTDSDFYLFVGTAPTVINYELTPSVFFIQVFESESSNWQSRETGYHIATDNDIIKGSQSAVETMNSNAFVLVKLSFTISNTGLVTHRVLNSTFFVFAGALLGAVFGLLGSVATLMSLVEGFTDKAKVRYLKDRKKKYLQTTRKILSDFFDHKILKNEASIIDKTPTEISAKVYPLDMSTKNDSFL